MEDLGARIFGTLKQYGWALNLVFLFTGAYFAASAVNSVLAGKIRGVPSFDSTQTTTPRSARRHMPQSIQRLDPKYFQAIAARNLFAAKRENLDPVVDEVTEANTVIDLTDLRKCTMPASLRGTLVADNAPEWSLAVIYVNSTKKSDVFSINEGSNEISTGLMLHEIRDRAVVVQRNDHLELCQAEGEGDSGIKGKPGARVSASSKSGADDGSVRKVSESEYEIDRSYIDSQMAQLSKIATQARIVPSFKNGKSNGFKLFSIKPGSIYSKIGMQNGDVIQRVNGYEMNSPEKGLEIYSKLKTESTITIDFLRRGRTQNRTYNIQ